MKYNMRAGRWAFFTPRELTSNDDIRKQFDVYQKTEKNPKRTEKTHSLAHLGGRR